MKKTLLSAAVAAALAVPAVSAFAEDAPPASPLSFNVGVVSDYIFRGISQTAHAPALQGGIDYAFSSGFYVGTWASNVKWVEGWQGSGSTEVDVYGGYRGAFANPDFTYDIGTIYYTYPSHGKTNLGLANPTTQELYASIGYKWVSAKYSYVNSSHFVGWYGGSNLDKDTRGSDYLELNANYDMGDGWTLIGHVGHQKVKDSVTTTLAHDASYTDWKLGVTKDVGFGVVGLAYSDTNAKGSCGSTLPTTGASSYCFPSNYLGGTNWSNYKDVAKGVWAASFLKTF
ncbi:MAG TPA: TorF family putative porin [Rhodocyclaceae bacterium]|nr:TorF family putative porin [Rhodocyclaceae bacterium]